MDGQEKGDCIAHYQLVPLAHLTLRAEQGGRGRICLGKGRDGRGPAFLLGIVGLRAKNKTKEVFKGPKSYNTDYFYL